MSVLSASLLRIVRTPAVRSSVAGVTVITLAWAWTQRLHAARHGADAVADLFGSLALPLLAYALVGANLGGGGLADSGRAFVRLGAPAGRVAVSTVATTMLAAAALGGLLGAAAVAFAHGAGDPPLAHDALQTLAVGATGGAAYAALFLLGSAMAGGFWGRGLLLVIDGILGGGEGLGAAIVPRGHVRSLLGGEAPFDLSPSESLGALAALAIVFAAVAVTRAARARV
jgi:hypothetical protein